ncbi:AraC family transcriptional regulator [Algimonas arctica]|uniref:AraC family transcriptional regulator n=1 Tax=Algimonas arctica TaxID=1479486 RepID=A0A8J3CPF8_9PROT|nr:AraC family transcriptional regulator [Algimonas arctica]GHA90084.1 AraC family transcriptional regulator [Algimonas arctica]
MTRLIVPRGETSALETAAKSIAGLRTAEPGAILPESDDESQNWMLLRDYFQLMRRMTAAASDESLGMSQRSLAPGTTDFVIDILKQADNLEDAMKRTARTYNLIHGGYFNKVTRRRDCLVYTIDDREFPYAFSADSPPAYSVMEGLLIFLHAMLTLTTGVALTPHVRCVRSRRPKRDTRDGFLSFWEAPVRCDAPFYALEYDLSVAGIAIRKKHDRPVSAATVYDTVNEMIAEREHRVAKNDLPQRIKDLMEAGVTEQAIIARDLGLSVATLRRRLSESGTSFRDLRHQALNKMAQSMLRQGRPIGDVAETLNYVDVRSFSRAFKTWNDMTPAAFIRQLGDADA